MSTIQILTGIITVSDRASKGQYDDLGGPALRKAAEGYGWEVLTEALVPDEKRDIQRAVREQIAKGCHLILTTGGTGVALRDVTPEAVREIGVRELPGFGDADGIHEAHTQRNSVAQPRGRCGQNAGHLPSGKTQRRGGMPWLCCRRHSPLRRGVTGSADELLINRSSLGPDRNFPIATIAIRGPFEEQEPT